MGISTGMRFRSIASVCALGAVVLAAVGTATSTTLAAIRTGGTATIAQQPGSVPNYVFPLVNGADATGSDVMQFQYLMYRPLYWNGDDGHPVANPELSLAYPPTYSNDGKTLTIKLRSYRWSDGAPVTSRDVEFWMNLLKAEKDNWWQYVAGEFPDNVVSMTYPSPSTFTITFNRKYNQQFLVGNQLAQIIPIPQQAWDRTSAGGAVGNYDMTAAGAEAVYNYLNSQSNDLSTYSSNPLWQTVDGPWRMNAYSATTSYVAFVPNRAYSGSPKPKLAKLEELPFTSDAAEYDALRAGQVDYGYVPYQDVGEDSYLKAHGYQIDSWATWGFNYLSVNFANPKLGPVFSQLYIRQAMQHLIDQSGFVKSIFHGLAYPTESVIPSLPSTPLLTSAVAKVAYSYGPSAAKALLTAHGWSKNGAGVDECKRPGTSSSECGKGVAKGTQLVVPLQYASGTATITAEVEVLKSDFAGAGIDLTLNSAPFDTVVGNVSVACDRSQPSSCSWALGYWGTGWTYFPAAYPNVSVPFGAGSFLNAGYYSSSEANSLMEATLIQNGLKPMHELQVYMAKNLPVLWMPEPYYQISAISSKLHGALPQDPLLNLTAENWTD
jgi:peptide/nickel transport system substrate-binding protein